MSNDVVVTNGNPLDLINQNNNQPSEDLRSLAESKWLPILAVAYGTSKMCKEQKAYPGQLTLGGQTNLGQSVEVVYLGYRVRASEFIKATKSFGETAYHTASQGDLRNNKVYNDFITKARQPGVDVEEGAEFLFYIPKMTCFCTFFAKKTLKSMISPVDMAGKGRLILLTTRLKPATKPGANDYFVVDVTPLNRAVVGSTLAVPGTTLSLDVDMPMDQFVKAYNIFEKPDTSISVADTTPDLND